LDHRTLEPAAGISKHHDVARVPHRHRQLDAPGLKPPGTCGTVATHTRTGNAEFGGARSVMDNGLPSTVRPGTTGRR